LIHLSSASDRRSNAIIGRDSVVELPSGVRGAVAHSGFGCARLCIRLVRPFVFISRRRPTKTALVARRWLAALLIELAKALC
jgi:hypothetical protein